MQVNYQQQDKPWTEREKGGGVKRLEQVEFMVQESEALFRTFPLLSLVISKDLRDLGLSSNDLNELVASLLLVDCTYHS